MMKFLSYVLVTQLTVGTVVLISTPGESNLSCSKISDFICNNNLCIPKHKRCDGYNDCLDSSDEVDCESYLCEEPYWFRCDNKKCISKSFVCDTENDCSDFSDEQQCMSWQVSTLKTSRNCSANEWRCSDRLCIPIEWVCNGEVDCLDGSDENVGCEKQTTCKEFKCKNGQCIPKEWSCDKTDDCTDGSDEESCDMPPENCSLDKGLFQCVNNEGCIKFSQLCDGIVNCQDESDESTLCSNTTCNLFNCSHSCIATHLGTQCLCPHGYHATISGDCSDINECEIYGICDQKCRNTQGSYECYCDQNYILQDDKKTCKIRDGEPVLIFSSKNKIRGYFLHSQLYFPIAKQLQQAIGVAFDGYYVYWTEIYSGSESIVRALEDGTHKQVLVTFGLGTPEDLSVDWMTGNIYFTDAEMQHIGVCTNDGMYCTVLINQRVYKPRSIVLNPLNGQMYWSDWGRRPEIGRANMDGTEDISFVVNEIFWPNGLALDVPNQRLYWTDAKSTTIESIRLDGSGRRIIVQGIVKHPYGLAVFENRIYWSDWSTHSIESCDKFTGKNHHVLIKQAQEYIYGIHIYHSAHRFRISNPCTLAFCSDICLLNNESYSCACPQNKLLDMDKHTCRVTIRNQQLIIGTRNTLLLIQYQQLGRHNITEIPVTLQNISALTYNSVNHSLFISDISSHTLSIIDLHNGHVNPLIENDLGYIVAMDFDPLGNNLYWCDSAKAVVEVLNLNTISKRVLLDDMTGDTPVAIVLVPEEGNMFVAFQTSKHSTHIDRFGMDGSDRTHVIEQRLLGPIHLMYDAELHRVFWADSGSGIIESTSTDGDDRHVFRTLEGSPVGIALLDNNVFWINRKSRRLYWAAKENDQINNKNIEIDTPGNTEIVHLISITPHKIPTHPCQQNNGNCSHLCLIAIGAKVCMCPLGMKLDNDKETCTKPKHCELNEFFCQQSDICISYDMHCNQKNDCMFGEDEKNCEMQHYCTGDYFQCQNNDCIKNNLVCDKHDDCKDNSDEENCTMNNNNNTSCLSGQFNCINKQCIKDGVPCDGQSITCNSQQFRCNSGLCIPKNWECDQELDCHDMSDEHKNCGYAVCRSPKFQCNNGLCIDSGLKCNKVNDCGDFSDEVSCAVTNYKTTCEANEFRCYQNNSLCLPISARCNGSSDCPQHEDEQGCSNCHLDEYECSNKKCIPRQWLCDHVDDCGDNSDENIYMCLHEQSSIQNTNTSCNKSFRCKNRQCIDISLACNDKDDCGDGSDEDGACSLSCTTDNNPCSHICMRTPTGPRCYCNSGYKLRGDGRTCIDIKECSFEPPVCSQICNEISGSFSCSCYDGYILRYDEKSCKSVEESMSLVFATSNKIYQLFYRNNTLKVLYSEKVSKISGIDVSVKKAFVYFTTDEFGTLHRIHLPRQVREYIGNVGRPKNLAVEWISENIYFINDDVASKSIRVCNFEIQCCTDVVSINHHSEVSALTVDAINGYLFYSQSSWKMFAAPSTIIYKCSLDGSNLQQIFSSNNNYITGLTYNLYRKILYYADYHSGNIYKIQYDGTNQVEIIANLTRPMSLYIFDDHLYLYTSNDDMTVCPLFKDYQACKSYNLYGRFSKLFVIYHSSRQPVATNVCENHNCTYLCIPNNNKVQCLCSSDKVTSGVQQCHSKQVKTTDYKQIKYEEVTNKKASSLIQKSTVTIVVIGIFITISIGVYYYFHKKRSGNFTISMRFQNPVYGYLQESSQEIIIHPGQHEYYNPMNSVVTDGTQDTKKLVF